METPTPSFSRTDSSSPWALDEVVQVEAVILGAPMAPIIPTPLEAKKKVVSDLQSQQKGMLVAVKDAEASGDSNLQVLKDALAEQKAKIAVAQRDVAALLKSLTVAAPAPAVSVAPTAPTASPATIVDGQPDAQAEVNPDTTVAVAPKVKKAIVCGGARCTHLQCPLQEAPLSTLNRMEGLCCGQTDAVVIRIRENFRKKAITFADALNFIKSRLEELSKESKMVNPTRGGAGGGRGGRGGGRGGGAAGHA